MAPAWVVAEGPSAIFGRERLAFPGANGGDEGPCGDGGGVLVRSTGEEEEWWVRIKAEAGGIAPAMEVQGGHEEGSGLVQGVHGREREGKE